MIKKDGQGSSGLARQSMSFPVLGIGKRGIHFALGIKANDKAITAIEQIAKKS